MVCRNRVKVIPGLTLGAARPLVLSAASLRHYRPELYVVLANHLTPV